MPEIPDDAAPQFGAKAVNLARLLRLGLPVPTGFGIAAQAYHQHLQTGNLHDRIRSAIPEIRASTGAARSTKLAEVRQWIIDVPIAVELRLAVERIYETLGTKRIAVRSSGTVEDLPGHSFAGQYRTYLGTCDIWECLGQIKSCWASMWSERAFEYREQARFDHMNARMSVLVQRLIPAEAAGVALTADPVTGARDRLVVESCFGLGETLVSGKVTPDRFVFSSENPLPSDAKSRLRAVTRHQSPVSSLPPVEVAIGTKTVQTVFATEWGVREWPVEEERQKLPSIDEQFARRVAELARQVELAFGQPQDIEWAKEGDQGPTPDTQPPTPGTRHLFLLQARPITTLPAGKSWEERQVWTNVNLAEALPEAAPPMTLSLAEGLVGGIFDWIMKLGGMELRDTRLIGYIAGRPYVNLNTFIGMIRNLPLINRMKLSDLFGGMRDDLAPKPEDVPPIKVNRLKFLLNLPGLGIWFLTNQPGRGRKAVVALRARTDQLQKSDYTLLPEDELPGQVTHGLEQLFASTGELGGAMTGMQYYSMLFDRSRKWFNDPESTVASHLLSSLGDITSAQAGLELWRLADLASARPGLKELILSGASWEQLRPQLNHLELGDEFQKRWDALMFSHGHHCRGEFDVIKPRWRDQPDFVLDTIRGFLRAGNRLNPDQDLRRRAVERDQFAEECRRRLRNPFKRLVFNFLLKQAQLGASVRENVRDDSNRRIGIARIVLMELGDRFVRRGIIAERDDIFFFYLKELEPVRLGNQSFDVRNTVADRKAEYQRNLEIMPPSTIVGKFDANRLQPEPVNEAAEILTGLAVSPGIVTGKARVITRYSHDEQVLPGEILVAPFTDPGWTPYFLPAAGIVVDIGGLLSHGSIVAREYGKPAVVNVGPATKIIKTGQTIQVDGDAGKVRIIR